MSGEREVEEGSEPISSSLLVSMPHLTEPTFHHSLILMANHDDEGSMGLIVNRPLPIPIADILAGLDLVWTGDPDATVWSGGPVATSAGWVLYGDREGRYGSGEETEVLPGIQMTASVETLSRLAADPPPLFRLLLGYAGWGVGQLDGELLEGAWLPMAADESLIFETPPKEAWGEAFSRLGLDPGSIVSSDGVQ